MATIRFMGKEVFTSGPVPEIGSVLPDALLCTTRLEDIALHQLQGPMLLNIFPSIDTSVCAKSFKTFCEQASQLGGLKLLHLSHDLPFALDRYLQQHQLQAAALSGYRSDFAEKMGVKISSGSLRGLCARCVILVDRELRVDYLELVPEITQEPNYAAAIDRAIDLC